jgi:hypothetical protein
MEEHQYQYNPDDEIHTFYDKVSPLIKEIIERHESPFVHESTLFGDNSESNLKLLESSHKIRQKQMKEGIIAQTIIGNFIGWTDLGVGHSSGLDCCKNDNSIIMDVKNKHNTCNSGSQKALFDKLSKYKKENPSSRCVWAIVNPKPGCKKLSEKIIYDGVEIEKIQGEELFNLVFTINEINYSKQIIEFVKTIMYN